MDNADLIATVNSLIIDKHITTTCTDFISTCYNLFYSPVVEDVTFTLNIDENHDSNPDEFTIPNIAKNESLGIEPLEGETDPEGVIIGALGQIYYNQLNHKVFFKSTEDEDASGWVFLFQRITIATEEDSLDNITQLLSNTQEIVTAYYNVFYNDTPMDVTLRLYNNEGVIEEMTIPNRAKSMKVGLSGEGSPEGAVEGTYGTFYVNTITSKVYVKSTPIGNTGWYELISAQELDAHNISPDAHLGFLARIEGDRTKSFNVGNPTSSSHAVNLNYVGALSDLSTVDKSNIVNAINEVNEDLDEAQNKASVISSSTPWCAISGWTDTNGRADLIAEHNSDINPYIWVDINTEITTDNIIEGNWKDDFGSITNFYNWGNEGKVFGAPLGTYFHGWSKRNGEDYDAQESNVGYANKPIIHEYSRAELEQGGNVLGQSNLITFHVAYSYCPYPYEISVYDINGVEQKIVPTNLKEGEWEYTEVTLQDRIASIQAYGTTIRGEWGVGPIHLIKKIFSPLTREYINFNVGPKYKELSIADINNKVTTVEALKPIDLFNYKEQGASPKDYYVMFNNNEFNHYAFTFTPSSVNVDETGYATISDYSSSSLKLLAPCTKIDSTDNLSIEFKYRTTIQDVESSGQMTIFTSNPNSSAGVDNGLIQIYTSEGKMYGSVGTITNIKETWEICDIVQDTDYTVEINIVSGNVSIKVNNQSTPSPTERLTDDIVGGFSFLNAGLSNFASGGIYLNTVKIQIVDTEVIRILIDGSSTDPYLYGGSISRNKVNPNNEGLWLNVSKLPLELVDNLNEDSFLVNDIPLAKVTISQDGPLEVSQSKTLPYCNREVDTPTSVTPAYVIESMKTDSYWYRLWSNGFCEQGGIVNITTSGTSITLPKAYKDIYYTITTLPSAGTVTTGTSITTSSFTLYPSANNTCRWGTQGYVADITGFIKS